MSSSDYYAGTASPADSYTYSYEGNALASISGTDNNASISGVQYSYDANGNMIHDGLKNLDLSYNLLNLPDAVSQEGSEKATYSWFADGSKYSVLDNSNNGYYYIGSLIYTSNSGNLQIESTDFAGGRINLARNTGNTLTQDIQYHHTDHLGSVRAITNQSGETIEQNAYYPFGGRHTFGNTYAQTTNRFKYNGKEEQTTGNLQYLDYGARMYDSKIARWFVQDPLSEKYYAQSQYNYCVNNPVMFVDPDGRDIWEVNYEGRIINRITDQTKDAIYMVSQDSDGNYKRVYSTDIDGNKVYNSISFEYGTIESQRSVLYSLEGNATDVYDVYKVRGDENGLSLFKFMSDNVMNASSVEFSLAQTGIKGDSGVNYITTGHMKLQEPGMSMLLKSELLYGSTIRSLMHSHRDSYEPSKGDIDFACYITNKLLKMKSSVPDFIIYNTKSKILINF